MIEDQRRITNEEVEREYKDEEEQELEKTDEEFGSEIVDVEEPSKEEIVKEYQDILIALGFTRYDNKEKGISCKLKAGIFQIGRTFTEKYPIGNMWVKCLEDCAFGKKGEFLKKEACMQMSQVKLFYDIRNGELPIPEPTVTGKVIGKSAKAVQIQFDEFGKTDTQWWGLGALKKDKEGVDYVPASYSKETEKYTPKMQVPRDIILKNFETEFTGAPLVTQTETAEKKEEQGEEEKAQSTAKGTLGDIVAAKEPESEGKTPPRAEGEKPTVPELIAKYVEILAQVTEAVAKEDRIKDREKGYAVKFIYYSVKQVLENSENGGSQEEQD